jgi:hypothetical protein
MSDINELIATNTVRAFNQGLQFGEMEERERIIELLDSLDIQFTDLDDPDYIVGDALDLIKLIKGEQE